MSHYFKKKKKRRSWGWGLGRVTSLIFKPITRTEYWTGQSGFTRLDLITRPEPIFLCMGWVRSLGSRVDPYSCTPLIL